MKSFVNIDAHSVAKLGTNSVDAF